MCTFINPLDNSTQTVVHISGVVIAICILQSILLLVLQVILQDEETPYLAILSPYTIFALVIVALLMTLISRDWKGPVWNWNINNPRRVDTPTQHSNVIKLDSRTAYHHLNVSRPLPYHYHVMAGRLNLDMQEVSNFNRTKFRVPEIQ